MQTITLGTVVSLLILNYSGDSHGGINGNENADGVEAGLKFELTPETP